MRRCVMWCRDACEWEKRGVAYMWWKYRLKLNRRLDNSANDSSFRVGVDYTYSAWSGRDWLMCSVTQWQFSCIRMSIASELHRLRINGWDNAGYRRHASQGDCNFNPLRKWSVLKACVVWISLCVRSEVTRNIELTESSLCLDCERIRSGRSTSTGWITA